MKDKDALVLESLYNNIIDNTSIRKKLVLEVNWDKFTDELPKTEGKPLEFDTITLPSGDSDAPAQRKDVRFQFLLEH